MSESNKNSLADYPELEQSLIRLENEFVNYFNQNILRFSRLWRFLYRYDELFLFLTNAGLFIGLISSLWYFTNYWFSFETNLRFLFTSEFTLQYVDVFIRVALQLLYTGLCLLSLRRLLFKKRQEKRDFIYCYPRNHYFRSTGNPYFRIKEVAYFMLGLGYIFLLVAFVGLSGSGDLKFSASFLVATFLTSILILLKHHNWLDRKDYLFNEYIMDTYLEVEYVDFLNKKLPDNNDPKLSVGQNLLVEAVPFPVSEAESGVVRILNTETNNGPSLIYELYYPELAKKLREPGNTLSAKISSKKSYTTWVIELERNFHLDDELR
ncbi:hypothetical protein N9R23_02175 [Saprospiraceae bacterium]|nr:hypothetical protein [Saprospiraceae bacterium]